MKLFSDLIVNVLKPPKTLADIDPGVKSILAEAVSDYRSSQRGVPSEEVDRRVEAGTAAVMQLVAQCESPIEKLIVPSLVFQPYGSNGPWVPAQVVREGEPRFAPVSIGAQVTVYDARFDFLMLVEIGGGDMMIAVECDGKDFHDKDKDFYRDRNWQRAGINTVRLSGSDINRAPRMAASRVAEHVLQAMIRRGLA